MFPNVTGSEKKVQVGFELAHTFDINYYTNLDTMSACQSHDWIL